MKKVEKMRKQKGKNKKRVKHLVILLYAEITATITIINCCITLQDSSTT